jgi:hypothetical protein
VLGLATIVRLALLVRHRSLWIDEARLGLNIASRGFAALTQVLDYNQSAPILYLWMQRAVVLVFGVSD